MAGSQFCGNHLPADDPAASKKSQKFKANARRRVPCPIDGAHTVYEYDLAKHVLVCNRVKDADAMKRLPYYSENINSGMHCSDVELSSKAPTTIEDGAKSSTDAIVPETDDAAEHTEPSAQQQQGLVDKLVRAESPPMVAELRLG